MPKVFFGVDQLILENPGWKKNRIGFLTNDSAYTSLGELSRVALIKNKFNITKLFSPEHGIMASFKDGSKVIDGFDQTTGIFVHSLYNETIGIPFDILNNLDLVLVDLQDVGVRCYTYIWSAYDLMCACAQKNIPMIILDRPNPLGGNIDNAEGPRLEKSCVSFIGRCNIPFTHYCSMSEVLLFLNKNENINASLEIYMCSWRRHEHFLNWELPWKKPSPGLKTFNACMLYPALCFFEATNINLARTEPFSFEFVGSSWLENKKLLVFDMFKVGYKAHSYLKDETQTQGFLLTLSSPINHPVLLGLKLLYEIKNTYSNYFKWMPYPTQANKTGDYHLDLLLGKKNAYRLFDLKPFDFHAELSKTLQCDWKNQISKFLLYK